MQLTATRRGVTFSCNVFWGKLQPAKLSRRYLTKSSQRVCQGVVSTTTYESRFYVTYFSPKLGVSINRKSLQCVCAPAADTRDWMGLDLRRRVAIRCNVSAGLYFQIVWHVVGPADVRSYWLS